jgi:two-component system chemotaxis response regulator CheY
MMLQHREHALRYAWNGSCWTEGPMVATTPPLGSASDSQTALSTLRTRRQVLVVEDAPDLQRIIEHALAPGGYEVVAVSDGEAALARLRGGLRPCVILLDLMMPGMDGYTFRNHQLNDPALSAVPVIVCSACTDLERHAAAVGATAYIEKPFTFRQLLRLVDLYSLRD